MKRRLLFLLLVLGVAFLDWAASGTTLVKNLETGWQDAALRLSGVRHWPAHVVLVTVDEASLVRFRDDPLSFWTPHFAKAAQRLRELGVKTIGIDFLFAVSPENWLNKLGVKQASLTYDAPLREQIHSGNVILVAGKSFDPTTAYDDILLPDAGFLLAVPDMDLARHVALADLYPDADGAMRNFVDLPTLNLPPGTDAALLPRFSLAALLAQHARGAVADASAGKREIAYSGPPGTIPRISLSRLLAEDAKDDALLLELAGKVVIIGGEFFGMGDVHATPYGASMAGEQGRVMIGAEVQANIVEQLLAGLTVQHMPEPLRLVLLLLLAACGAALGAQFLQGRWFWASLALIALISALFGISAWAVSQFYVLGVVDLTLVALVAFAVSASQMLTPMRIRIFQLHRVFGDRISQVLVRDLLISFVPARQGRESFPVAVLAFSLCHDAEAACERASEVIRELGGTVSSGEGHLLIGYFGWPIPTSNPCADALAAALQLRQAQSGEKETAGIALAAGEVLFVWRRGMISAFGDAVLQARGMSRSSEQSGQGILIAESALTAALHGNSHDKVRVGTAFDWSDGPAQARTVYIINK